MNTFYRYTCLVKKLAVYKSSHSDLDDFEKVGEKGKLR